MAVRTEWARAAEACVDGAALLSGRAKRGGVVPARAGGNAGAKRGGAVAWRSRAQAERASGYGSRNEKTSRHSMSSANGKRQPDHVAAGIGARRGPVIAPFLCRSRSVALAKLHRSIVVPLLRSVSLFSSVESLEERYGTPKGRARLRTCSKVRKRALRSARRPWITWT
jgi:hypothetical protein